MLKRLLLLLVLTTGLAYGQSGNTTVTAIVRDPVNQLYTNSPINISFFNPQTGGNTNQPLLNGSTFQTSYTIYGTDSFGAFTQSLPDNGVIDSSSGTVNTQWIFKICFSDRLTCFPYQTHIDCANNIPVACVSGVMDLSAPIQAVAALLPTSGIYVLNNTWTGINTFLGPTIFKNTVTIDPCDLKLLPGPVTICTEATAPRTWTIPDATDHFVGRATADTLTNKGIDAGTNSINNTTGGNVVAHYLRNNGTKYVDVPASQVAADVGGGSVPDSACPANQYGNAIVSSAISCAQVAYSQISGTPTIPTVPSGLPSEMITFTFCAAGCDVTGTPCTATGSSFAQCDNVITYPAAFAFSNTNYTVSCVGMEPADSDNPGTTGRVTIQTASSTTTTVTCRTVDLGDSHATYGRIGVIAMKR